MDSKIPLNVNGKVNYKIIQEDYINGLTLEQISQRYSLSDGQYLHRLRRTQDWDMLRTRREDERHKKVEEQVIFDRVALINRLNKLIERHTELLELKKTDVGIQTTNTLKISDYHKSVDNLDKLVKMKQLLEGQPTETMSITERFQVHKILIQKIKAMEKIRGRPF